jgi:tetratricopeptide (TPR) repeat protein
VIWLVLLLFLQTDPDQARFEQAQQFAAQGRCNEAEPLLTQLSEKHLRNAAIEFALGHCQFEQKDYLTAINSFRQVVEIDPKMVEARSLYGAALGLSGRTPEAIEQLREAARTDSEFEPSFRLLGMFEVEGGQTGPEARAALEKAVSLDGTDARAHYWLGQLQLLNKNYDEAEKEFSTALNLQPGSTQALFGHAKALAGDGRTDSALPEFQVLLKSDPASASALLGLATCLYDLQQFPAALTAAREAGQRVTDDQDRRATLWLLSRLYRVTGEPEKALENERLLGALEQAKNGELARFRALQEEAVGYRAAHDYVKVASTLEAALRIEQRQDSLVMLGDAYQALKRPRDAEKCYLQALAAGPEQGEIQRRLREVRSGLQDEKK